MFLVIFSVNLCQVSFMRHGQLLETDQPDRLLIKHNQQVSRQIRMVLLMKVYFILDSRRCVFGIV